MAQVINFPRDTTLARLAAAMEESNAIANANIDSLFAGNITPENVDTQFLSWWAAANTGKSTKTQLLVRWFNLLQSDKTFGVKFSYFATSQSDKGEFTDDSAELGAATPSTNTVRGTDPYCKQIAFWTIECEYEIDANGEIEIKTVDKVDPTYTRAGTHGMVGVAQKAAWMSVESDGTNWTKRYRTSRAAGYFPLPECVAPDGSIRSFMVHAKYLGGVDASGKPTSATGLPPMNYTISHNSQISEWRKRGPNYAGISICDINFRLHMYQLKYGKKGNSGTLEGCTSYSVQAKAAVAETGVTRVLLTEANAASLLVGSSVIVGDTGSGTSTDRNTASMYKLAKNVLIKSITSVTVDGTAYKAVNLDTAKAFDTTTDTYISTTPWWSGSCDAVLGVDGSPTSCTNGKEPFIIQGLESMTGGYAVVADVIDTLTVDSTANTMTITPATVRLAKNIATSKSSNYLDTDTPLTVPKPSGWAWHYIGELSHSSKYPEFTTPSSIDGGASSSNGYRSAVFLPASGGVYEWLSWDALYDGANAGLACALLDSGLGNANWRIFAGAPGSAANRGEWAG